MSFRFLPCSVRNDVSRAKSSRQERELMVSSAEPGADEFDQGWSRSNSARAQLQKDREFMIDVQSPKPKSLRILSGQTVCETICRPNFQIIQNDDRAGC